MKIFKTLNNIINIFFLSLLYDFVIGHFVNHYIQTWRSLQLFKVEMAGKIGLTKSSSTSEACE